MSAETQAERHAATDPGTRKKGRRLMSKTRPKARWWHWKTYGNRGPVERRLNRKGQRRISDREAERQVAEDCDE